MNTWIASPWLEKSAPDSRSSPAFLGDVCAGLCRNGQKSLPPKYLYDELGSILFDAITRLPEYGIWRAERRLLERHADTIAKKCDASFVVELGSGSAEKTRPVLQALLDRGPLRYCSVEISQTALDSGRRALADLAELEIRGVAAEYLPGLEAALSQRAHGERALVLFLGSSLGNFDPLGSFRFLKSIRRLLQPGDSLLLGADLEKPEGRLLAAYDDALGVTAAFNLNLLVRMNRELDADFRMPLFRHRVFYEHTRRNVEMHIESLCDQRVLIGAGGFGVTLHQGETIHTESSHKYALSELEDLLRGTGFDEIARWTDDEQAFATGLYSAA